MYSRITRLLLGIVSVLAMVLVFEGSSRAQAMAETPVINDDNTNSSPLDLTVTGTVRGSIRFPVNVGTTQLRYQFTASTNSVIAAQSPQPPDIGVRDVVNNRTVYAYRDSIAVSASAQANSNYTVQVRQTAAIPVTAGRTVETVRTTADASVASGDTSNWTVVDAASVTVATFRDTTGGGTLETCGVDFPANAAFQCTTRDASGDRATGIYFVPGVDRNNNEISGGVTYTVVTTP